MPVAIPELAPGSPLLQALPEFKSLENYGGATLEANIQAATTRFKLYNKAVDDLKNKIAAINNRPDSILGSDWQVSNTFSPGGSVSEEDIQTFRAVLRQRENTELQAAYRTFIGLKPSEAIGGQPKNIARLIDFLRLDDPNVPVADLIEPALRKGVKFTPATNRNGVGSVPTSVGEVVIPFKTENGVVVPAVDLSGYRQALSSLDTFRKGNTFPRGFDPKKISLRISATQADFEADFNKISRTNRDLSGTQGANIALRSDGSPVTRSQDLDGFMDDKTAVILINHEFNARTPGEFGGSDSVAETVLHEYGHSVHRTRGIGWGDPGSANPSYDSVRDQRISSYGDNNDQEHFAETFAKYMLTGEATPEFKSFLEERMGIKKFDLSTVFPEWMRGSNAREQYIRKMQETDLAGFTVEVTSWDDPYRNYGENVLANMAQNTAETGIYDSFSISVIGRVKDAAGRPAGTFSRQINRGSDGKVWVSHSTFFMDDSAQGSGFGTPFIEASFDLYREWGAEFVDVQAASTNGPYMWALRGFDFKDKSQRDTRLKLVEDYYDILSEYAKNEQELNGLSSEAAGVKIFNALDAKGIKLKRASSISAIVTELRQNGWMVDAELLQSLKNLIDTPSGQVTANMIAVLGQNKRRSRDRNSSSIGRKIMMISGWYGRKIL